MTHVVRAITLTALLSLLLALLPASSVLADSAWDTVQTVDEYAGHSVGPQVTIDGSSAVAVWVQNDSWMTGTYQIDGNYSTDGGATWEGAQTISAVALSYCDAPQVAMSGANVVAVWYEVAGSTGIGANCSTDGGATWGTAAFISDSFAAGTNAHVAISGDSVIATWAANDATGWLIYCNRSEDGGATWEGAELIASGAGTTGNTTDEYPRVSLDGENAVVAWVTTEGQSPWRKDVHSVHSADGGATWGASQVISDGAESYAPKLAMLGSNVVAIWNDNDGNTSVYVNHSSDGGDTWDGVENIDNGALGGKYSPQLSMSGSGVVAVWNQSVSGTVRIWSNRSGDGGVTWGASQAVDTTNPGNAGEPYVALSGTNAVAVWYQYDGTNERAYSSYSSDGGVTWSTPALIQNDVEVRGFFVRVAASGRHAVAVWCQQESTVDVFSNHLTMLESPPQFRGAWGTAGSGNSQFNLPQGISVAPDGSVYVSDTGNHRVQKFTTTGSYVTQWGSLGTDNGELNQPVHLTTRTGDAIYVCDGDNDRAQYFDSDGNYLGQFGTTGDMSEDGPGEFVWTFGIAIDSFFDVYVTDWGNHRVQKFDADGDYLDEWGGGLFSGPFGLATDSDDNVYLAEWGNNRIQKYDGSDWTVVVEDAELNNPSGIAVDADGNIYVCDTGNDRIQVFDEDGNLVTRWGSEGADPGQFRGPMGIAIHPNGDIYVADTDNHRIQVFSYSTPESIEIDLKAGWNMVSVPMAMFPSNSAPSTVFSGSVAVYAWNPVTKSYETPTTVVPECGYWVAVTTDNTITVTGTPVTEWESSLTSGWNMVGSVCGNPVAVADLTTDVTPDPLVRGAIYNWNPTGKSYIPASEIAEGLGYWVAATGGCTLTMCAPGPI